MHSTNFENWLALSDLLIAWFHDRLEGRKNTKCTTKVFLLQVVLFWFSPLV